MKTLTLTLIDNSHGPRLTMTADTDVTNGIVDGVLDEVYHMMRIKLNRIITFANRRLHSANRFLSFMSHDTIPYFVWNSNELYYVDITGLSLSTTSFQHLDKLPTGFSGNLNTYQIICSLVRYVKSGDHMYVVSETPEIMKLINDMNKDLEDFKD